MTVPKGKPFIRHINGNTLDSRRENMRWTSETTNSDAVLFDTNTQQVLLAASQLDDDDSRTLVVEAIFCLAASPFATQTKCAACSELHAAQPTTTAARRLLSRATNGRELVRCPG